MLTSGEQPVKYMSKEIANSDLTLEHLPDPGDEEAVHSFALSFNGYEYFGGFQECAEAARQRRRETLSDLRNELFWTARAESHAGVTGHVVTLYKDILPMIRQKLDRSSE